MPLEFSRISKSRALIWFGVVVVVVCVAAWIVYYGKEQSGIASAVQSFNTQAKQLLSFSDLKSAKGEPYLSGKVVILDKKNGTVDPMFRSLKSDLRANTIDEVKTIIWLEWGEELVGRYTSGGGAYVYNCAVTVIDRQSATLLETRHFRGSQPPSSKQGYGSAYGSKPDDDIVAYIESLPRK